MNIQSTSPQGKVLSILLAQGDTPSNVVDLRRREIIAVVGDSDGDEKLRQALHNVLPVDGMELKHLKQMWNDDAGKLLDKILKAVILIEQLYLKAMKEDEAILGSCILQHLEEQSDRMTLSEKSVLERVKLDIRTVGRMTYTWMLGVAFSWYTNPLEFNGVRYTELDRISGEIVRATRWEREELNRMVIES